MNTTMINCVHFQHCGHLCTCNTECEKREYDTDHTYDVICPFCGEDNPEARYSAGEMEDGNVTENIECLNCGEKYRMIYDREVVETFITEKM